MGRVRVATGALPIGVAAKAGAGAAGADRAASVPLGEGVVAR